MRTFIALELPELFAEGVSACSRSLAACIEGKFVPPENHHITLAFLGDVGEADAQRAIAALDNIEPIENTVELIPTGLGTFGRGANRVLWIGLEETDALMKLARAVRSSLNAYNIGFDEKAFIPHITLARHANVEEASSLATFFPEPEAATAVTLFKSTLSSEGASYKPLYSRVL